MQVSPVHPILSICIHANRCKIMAVQEVVSQEQKRRESDAEPSAAWDWEAQTDRPSREEARDERGAHEEPSRSVQSRRPSLLNQLPFQKLAELLESVSHIGTM